MEKIIQLDRDLLVYLNGLGSETFDPFWLFITKQLHLTPLFLFVFYLVYKKVGGKNLLLIIVSMAVMITFTDQFTNLVKNTVQRLRPCNDEELKNIIRVVKTAGSYSCFSGHAANSMASTVFVFMILKKYYKYAISLFLFPLIFAYSRIYLGLHFPGDILSGYLFGAISGFAFYKIYVEVKKKYFPQLLD